MFSFLYDGAVGEWIAPRYDANDSLFEAVFDGDETGIETALENGADADATNEYGNKPLHVAAYHGNTHIARMLLNAGAQVNAKGRSGQTPLHFAARQGHVVAVDLLVENGAASNDISDLGYGALHFAAFNGHHNVIVPLVMNGANVNLPGKDGATPLHWAVHEGHVMCINILLDKGADSSIRNDKGETPIDLCKDNIEAKAVFESRPGYVAPAPADSQTPGLTSSAQNGNTSSPESAQVNESQEGQKKADTVATATSPPPAPTTLETSTAATSTPPMKPASTTSAGEAKQCQPPAAPAAASGKGGDGEVAEVPHANPSTIAQAKFSELDTNNSGKLERAELSALAEWVYEQFHPNEHPPLTVERRENMSELLLQRLDTNHNGAMDFEEFLPWFNDVCARLAANNDDDA